MVRHLSPVVIYSDTRQTTGNIFVILSWSIGDHGFISRCTTSRKVSSFAFSKILQIVDDLLSSRTCAFVLGFLDRSNVLLIPSRS